MNKTAISAVILLAVALSSPALATTDEERCQTRKLIALGKRDLCLQERRAREVLHRVPDTARKKRRVAAGTCDLCLQQRRAPRLPETATCDEEFAASVRSADEVAAKRGASCRWLKNGDGTATDLNSGLQWELKTDDGSIHDVENRYSWSKLGSSEPEGTVFRLFLGVLNGGSSSSGETTEGCFADKCDWRLPTVEELRSLLIEPPPCSRNPCTTIPGPTGLRHFYWSSSTLGDAPRAAWDVDFSNGVVTYEFKDFDDYVRAVRGGR